MAAISRRIVLAAVAALSLAACNKGGGKVSADEMTLGNPNAKVTVIEYASASCSHCARFNNEVYPDFKKKYIDSGKVHYVFREFLTPPVQLAAAGFLLARCAGKDKYFSVLDSVFRSQDEMFTTGDLHGVLLRIALSAGLTEDQFTKCIADEKAANALNARVQKAMDTDKIQSTPTFVINGKHYEGEQSLAKLDAAIQPLLK